jgi:hypothetical protein
MDDNIIIQPGFVSNHPQEMLPNGSEGIFFPVTGHFIRLKDEPGKMWLYDDYARFYNPIENVAFLWDVCNPQEGYKKMPRPFVVEQSEADKAIPGNKIGTKVISAGDKVMIMYVEGKIYNPIVVGSIEAFKIYSQNRFLLFAPDEWEKEVKRYSNDDYTIEEKNDGAGEFTIDITAKKKDDSKKNKGGTGNITINLTATDENGKITINQKTIEGKTTQQVLLDNTLNKNLARVSQGISTEEGTGEDKKTVFKDVQYVELDQAKKSISLIQKTSDASEIQQSVVMDNTGKKITVLDVNKNSIETSETGISVSGEKKLSITVKGDIEVKTDGNANITVKGNANVTATGNAVIKGKKITLNNGMGKVLTDLTATPACLFSGKPFPGVPTVEAG